MVKQNHLLSQKDQKKPACVRCGAPSVDRINGEDICLDCYAVAGACCAGECDDTAPTDESMTAGNQPTVTKNPTR